MINEIKLSVDDKNLEIVVTILENLKSGLLENIEINARASKTGATQYQPKTNRIIKEQDSGVNDSSGKYVNPTTYRQRLNKK